MTGRKDLAQAVVDAQAAKLRTANLPKGLKPSKALAHSIARRGVDKAKKKGYNS